MIEIYLNPDNETRWDGNLELKYYSGTAGIVVDLFKDLETFTVSRNIALKIEVLKAYSHLANQPRGQTEKAMKSFIGILEREKDYLPALLGMSTAFLFDQSTTKARNALKRIARMPYSYALAEHFERGYLLLADIYVQKCKFDLSEDLCSRCLKYNLSCGKAWETMGSIREKEASYKDAADMYEKAWLLEHQASATIGFKLAFNYLKAKRYVEAIDVCNKVLSLYPDYPQIRKEILEKAMSALRS
jgi:tetratricopeptide repeat protein 21B